MVSRTFFNHQRNNARSTESYLASGLYPEAGHRLACAVREGGFQHETFNSSKILVGDNDRHRCALRECMAGRGRTLCSDGSRFGHSGASDDYRTNASEPLGYFAHRHEPFWISDQVQSMTNLWSVTGQTNVTKMTAVNPPTGNIAITAAPPHGVRTPRTHRPSRQ